MKNAIVLPALLAVALAACGGDTAPEAGAPAAPAAEATPAPAPEPSVPKGRKLKQPLPEGVVYQFPLHFRGQSVVELPSGQRQRRVTVEFLGGDVASTTASLKASMQQAGFRLASEKELEGGRQRLVFGKKGYGRVTANVSPRGTTALRNPAASGTVYTTWPETGGAVAGR
jgi:uncharacterized lipoprotein